VIAGLLAAAGQMATGALTPAGGATALVVALGAESADWRGVLHLGVGWCW
jgi:CBS-domain-containing membrane protein